MNLSAHSINDRLRNVLKTIEIVRSHELSTKTELFAKDTRDYWYVCPTCKTYLETPVSFILHLNQCSESRNEGTFDLGYEHHVLREKGCDNSDTNDFDVRDCLLNEEEKDFSGTENHTPMLKENKSRRTRHSKIHQTSLENLAKPFPDRGKKYICDICHRKFKSKTALIRHFQQKCSTNAPAPSTKLKSNRVPCGICGKLLASEVFLRKHLLTVHLYSIEPKNSQDKLTKKIHSCDKCDVSYANPLTLSKHIFMKHNSVKRFHCKKCSRSFDYPYLLKDHIKKLHEMERPICYYCTKRFANKISLLNHMKRGHKIPINVTESSSFECSLCNKSLCNKWTLMRHVEKCIEFGAKREIRLFCKACDKEFASRDSYRKHLWRHDKKDQQKPFKCDRCSKAYTTQKTLKEHFKANHELKDESKLRCTECDKTFKTEKCLNNHIRLHTKIGTYICPVCGKIMNTSGNLSNHLLIHSKAKEFTCDICAKSFSQPAGLTVHKKQVHQKIRFPCRKCNLILDSYMQRYDHEWNHDHPDGIDCEMCGKNFNSKLKVTQHIKTVHLGLKNKSKKLHQCLECSYETHSKVVLEQHMVKHTGEKPFVCDCGQSFGWKRNLSDHKNQCRFLQKSLNFHSFVPQSTIYTVINPNLNL